MYSNVLIRCSLAFLYLICFIRTGADCYCRDLVIVILNNGSPINYICFSESKSGDLPVT